MNTIMIKLTFHYSAIKPKNFLGTLDLAFKLTFHYSAIKPIFDRDRGDKFDSINIPL